MMSPYRILIINTENDDDFTKNAKALIYDLAYMDNLGFTASNPDVIAKIFDLSKGLFAQYGFELQQICSNVTNPQLRAEEVECKLLGLLWDQNSDTKLFLHELQLDKTLGWDDPINESRLKIWRNISKQVNNSDVLKIKRSCGDRKSKFHLICFTDASIKLFGCVIYLLDLETNDMTFVHAKNRVVTGKLSLKSIPVLE